MGVALLILVVGAAGILLAARFYLRHEVEVPGKGILLGLRIAVLLLVTLLLLDVSVGGTDPARAAPAGGTWVLLDGDLSLLATPGAGTPLWDRALELVRAETRRGARVALAVPGVSGVEGVDLEGLEARGPSHPPGDLEEGIRRLAEAGADSIVVISTLRRPAALLERLRDEAPAPLHLVPVGTEGPTRNAGVLELSLPDFTPTGEPAAGRVSVFAEGVASGETVEVAILVDGVEVTTLLLPAPGPGVTATATFSLPAHPDTGLVRVTAEVALSGDAFPVDDLRAAWMWVGEPAGGVLLVSLAPDWEPRTLLPVLEAVTGLEAEGYLSLGAAGFLPLASEDEALRPVPPERFRNRIPNARLFVLHGAGATIPPWLAEAVREHPRVLHLPAGREGAALAGVSTGALQEGEWPPVAELPPSPVSPFLAGARIAALPPLTAVLVAVGGAGQPVLFGRPLRGGADAPLVVLRETEEGRRAVVLAQGFWRWGTRDGEPRQVYRSLWGGVASWLLDRPEASLAQGVRPVDLVQGRGAPLRWSVPPGAAGAELRLIHLGGESGPGAAGSGQGATGGATGSAATQAAAPRVVYRELLEPDSDGVALTAAADPGLYAFEVRDPDAGTLFASGSVEVEAWAPSLRHPPLAFEPTPIAASAAAGRSARGEGRPLRTHPLPYFLILLLLSAEWFGRRRVGLR